MIYTPIMAILSVSRIFAILGDNSLLNIYLYILTNDRGKKHIHVSDTFLPCELLNV